MAIPSAILSINQKIVEWDSDFNNNYETFANSIADFFAIQVTNDFAKNLNPYKTPISKKNRYIQKLSLDITQKSSCEKITELFRNNKSDPLPPFKEWLTIFSRKESDPLALKIEDINIPYFTEAMQLLGTTVAKKVSIKLYEYNTKVNNFCADAKMRKKFVEVRVWLNQPSELLPQIVRNIKRIRKEDLGEKMAITFLILVGVGFYILILFNRSYVKKILGCM